MKTKEQAATPEENGTADASQEKKTLSELDLIGRLASRYAVKELNKLLVETGVFKVLLDKIMIADFKASVCYEMLTESQRQQARQLLRDKYKADGIEFTAIEEVLERAKAKL